MGAQFRLTLPRQAGAILETSPLPMVPRDLVGPDGVRLVASESPPSRPPTPAPAPTGTEAVSGLR
jgi:two-component system sensor histidine kinase MtrB